MHAAREGTREICGAALAKARRCLFEAWSLNSASAGIQQRVEAMGLNWKVKQVCLVGYILGGAIVGNQGSYTREIVSFIQLPPGLAWRGKLQG